MNFEQALEKLCTADYDSVITYVGNAPATCMNMLDECFPGSEYVLLDDGQLVIKTTLEIEEEICTDEPSLYLLDPYGLNFEDFEW